MSRIIVTGTNWAVFRVYRLRYSCVTALPVRSNYAGLRSTHLRRWCHRRTMYAVSFIRHAESRRSSSGTSLKRLQALRVVSTVPAAVLDLS